MINLKNAVDKLTYGDDNGKFSLSAKSYKYCSKYSVLLQTCLTHLLSTVAANLWLFVYLTLIS